MPQVEEFKHLDVLCTMDDGKMVLTKMLKYSFQATKDKNIFLNTSFVHIYLLLLEFSVQVRKKTLCY